jgi:hypothetical protein
VHDEACRDRVFGQDVEGVLRVDGEGLVRLVAGTLDVDVEQLVYVGVSQNFRERVKRHRRDKEFDGWIAEIQADRQNARKREADMISHYKPIYNVAGVWS